MNIPMNSRFSDPKKTSKGTRSSSSRTKTFQSQMANASMGRPAIAQNQTPVLYVWLHFLMTSMSSALSVDLCTGINSKNIKYRLAIYPRKQVYDQLENDTTFDTGRSRFRKVPAKTIKKKPTTTTSPMRNRVRRIESGFFESFHNTIKRKK